MIKKLMMLFVAVAIETVANLTVSELYRKCNDLI